MSEKLSFSRNVAPDTSEEDRIKEMESIVNELNDYYIAAGLPRVELDMDREKELDRDRGMDLDRDREMELDIDREKELEEIRKRDVQKFMADDLAEKGLEKVGLKTIKPTDINDPDMREIVLDNAVSDITQESGETVSREAEIAAIQKELASTRENVARLEKVKASLEPEQPKPLAAIGVDWSESEEKLAQKAARADLKKELKDAGIIKKVWKGKLFREYYEDKYTDEYLDGKRTDRNGKSIAEAIEEQKQGLIDDLVEGAKKDINQISQKDWDKNGFVDKNGKRLIPVEKETNDKIREAIENYAHLMIEAESVSSQDEKINQDIEDGFNKEIGNIIKRATREGRITSDLKGNNYLDVAKQAYERYREAIKNITDKVEQDAAMAQVMAGFQAYNVETTKSFSVSHKSNLVKIQERIEKLKSNIVPPEVVSQAVEQESATSPEPELESNIISSAANSQTAEQAPEPKPEPEPEPTSSEPDDSAKDQEASEKEKEAREERATIIKEFNELTKYLKENGFGEDQKLQSGLLKKLANEIAAVENAKVPFPDSEDIEYVEHFVDELRAKHNKQKEITSEKEAAVKEYEDFVQYLNEIGINDPKLYAGLKQKLDNKLAQIENNPALPDTPEQKYVDDFLKKFETSDEGMKVTAREAEQFRKQNHEQWESQITGELFSKSNLIGGPEGISIILSNEKVTDPRFRERCKTWWDNLSYDGKQVVREFVEETNKEHNQYHNRINWGSALRYWLPDIDK